MRKTVIAVLTVSSLACLALMAYCLRPSAPPPPERSKTLGDEAPLLTASNGLAWRENEHLNLRLKSGEVLTLADRITCGDIPCPHELSARYRFLGWDALAGGYALQITPSASPRVILPFSDDDMMLIDARRLERQGKPMPQPSPPVATEADNSLVEWLADIANDRNQSEAPAIEASHGSVARQGASLILSLTDRKKLVLTDDISCGQVACPQQIFRSYDYVGASPDGRFQVVEEHWREANAALLIDTRQGGISFLLGLPKFSPDGKRAVASVTDLEWSAPRRLEVWSLTGAVPNIEFSLPATEDDDTIFEVSDWNDPDHVLLKRGPWASRQRSPAMLSHDESGWHLGNSEN